MRSLRAAIHGAGMLFRVLAGWLTIARQTSKEIEIEFFISLAFRRGVSRSPHTMVMSKYL
jgi:hypothetical protein